MKVLYYYNKADKMIARHMEMLNQGLGNSADLCTTTNIYEFKKLLETTGPDLVHLHGCWHYETNKAAEMCYKRGGNPTLAVMSGKNKRRFSKIITGQATKQRGQKEKAVYNVTDTYISDFGTITAKVHRQYGDDRIDMLDMSLWEIKYFTRPHEVTGLPKKGSYDEFVLASCMGLQGTQPKASGSIVNIKMV
jgi:hypothetical protein